MQEMLPEFPHWLFSCISILFVNSKKLIIKLDPKLSKEEVVYTEMNSVDDRASLSLVYWLLAIATIHFQVFPILIWILSRLNKIGISRKRAHSQGTHYVYVSLHGWNRNWKAFYKKLLPNLFVIQLFSQKTSFFCKLKWVGNKIGEILKEWEVVKENHWLQ